MKLFNKIYRLFYSKPPKLEISKKDKKIHLDIIIQYLYIKHDLTPNTDPNYVLNIIRIDNFLNEAEKKLFHYWFTNRCGNINYKECSCCRNLFWVRYDYTLNLEINKLYDIGVICDNCFIEKISVIKIDEKINKYLLSK